MSTVGVLANADSGRDIRRLATGATVFDNAEKAAAISRLIAGCAAEGVKRILMMPTAASLLQPLSRHLAQLARITELPIPEVQILDFPPRFDPSDTLRATSHMIDQGSTALAVLGGDGTHRLVASECGDTPLLALSSGTNNAFPSRHEETTAGRALGLVALAKVEIANACRRERALSLTGRDWRELALVDVALTRQRFTGAKAIWRATDLSEVLVVFSDPTVIGLSAVGSAVRRCTRGGDEALRICLDPESSEVEAVLAPIAPGLFEEFRVRSIEVLRLHQPVQIWVNDGSIALDGERTVETHGNQHVEVELICGPWTIEPRMCLDQWADMQRAQGNRARRSW